MLSSTTRKKLIAFAVLTTATLTTISVTYMRLPQQLGHGVYEVDLELPSAAGLYPSSAVTYRGVDVGTVKDLDVTADGIVVRLSLDDDYKIPVDVRAEVHSASAIGEQYVDLIPLQDGRDRAVLTDKAVIPMDAARLPVSTTALLSNVNDLVRSVPKDSLATVVDEVDRGLAGSGDDLGRLLDSAILFQESADQNLDPTLALINSLVPVLRTQQAASSEIASYTEDLAGFSGALAAEDNAIRGVLRKTGPLTEQLNGLYADLAPTLPTLLADLATTARVAEAYVPGLEHLLIVFPAVIGAAQGVVPPSRYDDPMTLGNLDFKASVNSPPVCTEGFADAGKHRSPHDQTEVAPPTDSYCDIASDDPRVVRGARNVPCPDDSGRRGPSAASCGLVFDRVRAPMARAAPRTVTSYDPATGSLLGPDGRRYRLADMAEGGSQPETWQKLLLETVRP